MISTEMLNRIGERYGQYSSWAIWDPEDIRDTTLIAGKVEDLRTDVVMVGLNVPADVSGAWWTNFHAGRNDPKLRLAFNESRLRGSYMTDILKDVIAPTASDVMRMIRSGEIDVSAQLRLFNEEMQFIHADETNLFLVFGGHARRLFAEHLADSFPNHIYCEHFACYRKKEDWLRDLRRAIDAHQNAQNRKPDPLLLR